MGKADLLVQGIRAKSYDPENVALGILAIVEEFYFGRNIMCEPDCSQWVQDANEDMQQFNERCDALMYCTSGDPKASWHFIQVLKPHERVELMGELLDYFLYSFYMFKKEEEGVPFQKQLYWEAWKNNPEGFVWTWNKYWDEDCGFETREEVIHHFCTSEHVKEAGIAFKKVDSEWMDGFTYSQRLEWLKKHHETHKVS